MTSAARFKGLLAGLILSAALALSVSAPAEAAPPGNDDFANAQVLTGPNPTAFGTNVDATSEPGEPNHWSNSDGRHTVWYSWTPSSDARVSINTRGSAFDTVMAVYTGTELAGIEATQVGSNDEEPGSNQHSSGVTLDVTGGTTYRIAVDGYQSGTGALRLSVDLLGTVTGTVTDSEGDPAENACISLRTGASQYFHQEQTTATGEYTIPDVIEGTYRVRFGNCQGNTTNYLPEYYDDQPDFNSGEPVTVDAGETESGIDAQLADGNRILGTVTNDLGEELEQICVFLYDGEGEEVLTSTQTSAGGDYLFAGLADGSYLLRVFGCTPGIPANNVIAEFYENASSFDEATPIDLADGEDQTADFSLERGGSISGNVTDAQGAPRQDICVFGQADGQNSLLGITDANGDYTITGLRQGDYIVLFTSCAGGDYLPEYYDDVQMRSQAEPVAVATGQDTPDIDAELNLGGKIGGTVSGPGNVPADHICVEIYSQDGQYVGNYQTDESGLYETGPLAAGGYKVGFEDCETGEFKSEFYNDKANLDTANVVTVTAEQTTPANAVLALSGAISGRVTGPGNAPLEGICVSVRDQSNDYVNDADTNEDGEYRIGGLGTGQYKVRFRPCGNNVIEEYYNDKPTFAAADNVAVTDGSTTANINAQLAAGASFSGTLTDEQGDPLSDVCVDAINAEGNYVDDTETDENGEYALRGLGAGTYRAQFYYCGGPVNVAGEFYDDKASFATATPISLTAGSNRANVDAQLAPGAAIEGTVTDEDDDPLDYVCVTAYDAEGNYSGSGYTGGGDGGHYAVMGLRAGAYRLVFEGCDGQNVVREFYDDKRSLAEATPVSVATGATTAGIDVQLATGGTVTGVVTGTNGAPVADICITGLDADGNYLSGSYTQEDGTYLMDQLPEGDVRVFFEPCEADMNYLGEYYDNKATLASANAVAVVKEEITPGIDAVLASDTTGPDTVIDSGPSGTTIDTPQATFSFRGDPAAETTGFECRLDAGAFEPCVSPKTFTGLAEGSHTVHFRAMDQWGNVDATPATATFTVQLTPVGPTQACLTARAKLKNSQAGLSKANKVKKKAVKGKKAAVKGLKKAKKSRKAPKIKQAKRKLKAKTKNLKTASRKVKKANTAVRSAKSAVTAACG